MNRPHPAFSSVIAATALAFAAGCAKPKPEIVPAKPTEVIVALPVVGEVTDYEDFPGRTDAVAAIDLRARVTGYLKERHFKDGVDVAAGDLLFVIDPRPFQASFDKAMASLASAKAHADRLEKDFKRLQGLKGVATQEELDRVAGDKAEADASVKQAEAAREEAKLNLDFTRISAPISGRISRRYIDEGNLAKADETILTSIVALDPIDVNFDIDERTLLRLRRLIQEGKMPSARQQKTEVLVGVADEDGYPHVGVIEFIDNKVDPGTGTLRLRAAVRNEPRNKSRLLSPGLFARVRLSVGVPHKAVLVPEEAVGTDQGQKFVFVVDDANKVAYRQVKLGQTFDRLREVESGVGPKDRVIVSGLQRVRAGAAVAPKMTDKPLPPPAVVAAMTKPEAPPATAAAPPTRPAEAAVAPRVGGS